LATSASVNTVIEPIVSNSVWGAGWYNAPTVAHYADSGIRWEGSIDIEVNYGVGGAMWNFIKDWGLKWRAYSRSVDISPDGVRVYKYHNAGTYAVDGPPDVLDNTGMWCDGLDFSTSEGSFVTCSMSVKALNRVESDPSDGAAYDDFKYINNTDGVGPWAGGAYSVTPFEDTSPLNPCGTNVNPIPFWRTNANLFYSPDCESVSYIPFATGSGVSPQTGLDPDDLETVDWSIALSNNSVLVYTCNGDRLPTALFMGPIDATGNVTLFHPISVFDPILGPTATQGTLTDPYLFAQVTWFRVEIATGLDPPNDYLYLELPTVIVESDDFGLKGQSDVTNRAFTLKGLGGRVYSSRILPSFLMSDEVGAYDPPTRGPS